MDNLILISRLSGMGKFWSGLITNTKLYINYRVVLMNNIISSDRFVAKKNGFCDFNITVTIKK